MMIKFIDVVFDRMPGHEGSQLIEVEDETGKSINVGEWRERLDGFAVLRIPRLLDLTELLQTQELLQTKMGNPTGFGELGCKENILQLIVEAVEALREINFKPWKTKTKEVDRAALATEMTDILQFWANATLAMGFTAEDLTMALRAKWQVNQQRIASNEDVSAGCIPDPEDTFNDEIPF